jgi:hypothetical protein
MENMVKQMQLDLEATRMSTHYLVSNQLRLWFSAFACLLLERLRALTLGGSELARATAGTIRLRLLKVGAQIKVSARPAGLYSARLGVSAPGALCPLPGSARPIGAAKRVSRAA